MLASWKMKAGCLLFSVAGVEVAQSLELSRSIKEPFGLTKLLEMAKAKPKEKSCFSWKPTGITFNCLSKNTKGKLEKRSTRPIAQQPLEPVPERSEESPEEKKY
jgi:hypothetical protein